YRRRGNAAFARGRRSGRARSMRHAAGTGHARCARRIPPARMIAALLLAAGSARRFGAPKLLEQLHGKPIVRWSAEALVDDEVGEVVCVVGGGGAEIRRALRGLDVRFVTNANAERGMGASLSCGVSALAPETEALLVALADEPLTERDVLRRVVQRYREGKASVVA